MSEWRGDSRKWYAYECTPIDEWTGWHSLRTARVDEAHEDPYVAGLPDVAWFRILIPQVMRLFREMGWEGDGNWYLTALPNPDTANGSELVVAVKQSNNGTTYLASTMQMPWVLNDWTTRTHARWFREYSPDEDIIRICKGDRG